MSGGSTANNSWTILTSEETVAETLKPLAGGADHDEESHTSSTGSGDNNPPANGAEAAEALPVEDNTVSEGQTEVLNGDSSTDQHTAESIAVTDDPIKSSLEVPASAIHSGDEVGQTQVLPEEPAQFSPDPDSFSDSYTHITPSLDEPPPSVLSVETLRGAEFSPEEEKLSQEGMLHPLNGEKLHQEEEESDFYLRTTDSGKQAEPVTDPEVVDATTQEEESEVRRRRSLLAALEQIGRREEEEEEAEEEEFKLPEREEGSGFSVNKCILGALILLGLGTIFFSESDYSLRELKDAAVPGKQEWPNPEVPPPPPSLATDNSELLNKLAEGNEQISVLQAQLQAQKEELKVAEGHEAEGAKERLRLEEVEKENSRLKTEMASLPVLQKENERMKKELEAIPALQKEVETLRSTVTELKLSSAGDQSAQAPVKPTSSPSGQPEDSRPETAGSVGAQAGNSQAERKEKKRDKYDMGEKKDWKEKEKYVWKDGDKSEHKDGGETERKRGKHEFDKQKEREGKEKRHSEESKRWKEKEWKKDKDRRGDEGKPWKNREGKKEWKEKSDHREVKEKDRKEGKFEKVNEGKRWRSKEENKELERGKDHGERHKSKEEWKGEKEWKKGKDGYKESGKARKDWKEKGEKKEWKHGNSKDHNKEGRGERKQWESGKNKERKDEKKSRNGKYDKEWKRKDEKWEEKKKDKSDYDKSYATGRHGHKEEHRYGDRKPPHSHSKPSVGQPEYWSHQRDRLHHNPKPPQLCDSVESCAKAERLLPVSFTEFQAVLLTYLTKAEEAGVEKSKIEELQKLTPDFFKDGLFVHDQMSFQDFVEDLGDILEDMVEGDDEVEDEEEEEEEEPDSAIEEYMEGFKREVLKKFALAVAGEKEKRVKGEWRKESGQGRG